MGGEKIVSEDVYRFEQLFNFFRMFSSVWHSQFLVVCQHYGDYWQTIHRLANGKVLGVGS
jgi:hypothetical protein